MHTNTILMAKPYQKPNNAIHKDQYVRAYTGEIYVHIQIVYKTRLTLTIQPQSSNSYYMKLNDDISK